MAENEIRGLVFNIQRFSLHDGPGIRTIVFLKGCPLRCIWCSNPESQRPQPELMTLDRKCIRCGKCVRACPDKAITLEESGRKIDRALCRTCDECAQACPSGSIEVVGKHCTIGEIVTEIEKDRLFYQNSEGGVTLSGGEPLMQSEFALNLARESRARGLHVALETCGQATWDIVEPVLEYVDLVLYDIKDMDSASHEEATGVPNDLILSNARKVSARVRTWIRYPVVPGYNDSKSQVKSLATFASKLSIEKVSVLPYHAFGEPKYQRLAREYPLSGAVPPSRERMEAIGSVLESSGLKVTVGY